MLNRFHTARFFRHFSATPGLLLVTLMFGVALGAGSAALAEALPKVRVASDGHGFLTASGKRFVPMGVTYFRPGTGWAPQVWKRFDAEATRKDFAKLHELGGNCVRVFLTFGSFYEEPGRLSADGLTKFDQFLALAEEAGLYVHPTGPDHWEGLPAWAQGDRFAEEKVLGALEQFWKLFAARYRGRNVIFAYDLLNEPEVRWDSPAMREKWHTWLASHYGTAAKVAEAWGTPARKLELDLLPVPSKEAPAGKELLDYQFFREDIADQWTRRQAVAVKSVDPQALVTAGLIQWSVPVGLAGPFHYSAFRPERQARWLDFMEVHFYPLANGFYEYQNEEAERRNLAYLECVVRETARWGKPTLIAEFGWYGGGKLTIAGGRHPAATEEQQARWCRRVIETTAGWSCGWLNWGFHDHPGAGDVTELTGLLTAEGQVKAWGKTFHELARQ
ncbi:MAG TPA: beta-galactosidase, partial [Bacillota bacterium]|nr:beta-galactosidase [Bacillota bacterium]